jgi:hypothetical protein
MIRRTLLALAATAALSGCLSSTGTIYHTDDPYSFFKRAANRGTVPVMVLGDPYPGRRAGVETAVLSALDRNFKSFGNPFRVVPPTPGTSSRVVVLFTAPGARPLADAVCRDASQPGLVAGPTADQIYMGAIYCADGPASEAWVWLAKPAGPEAPEFQEAMTSLINYALPREIDPTRRNSSSDAGGIP